MSLHSCHNNLYTVITVIFIPIKKQQTYYTHNIESYLHDIHSQLHLKVFNQVSLIAINLNTITIFAVYFIFNQQQARFTERSPASTSSIFSHIHNC